MYYAVFFILLGDDLAVLGGGKKNTQCQFVKQETTEKRVCFYCLCETTLFLPKAKLKAENMSKVAGGRKGREK